MKGRAIPRWAAAATMLLIAVSAFGQNAHDTRVISGVGYAFRVTAPSGWRFFDEDPQVNRRLGAYFLPITPQPASGWAIMRVTAVPRTASDAPNVRAWVDAEIASIASTSQPMALGVTELPRFPEDPPESIYIEYDDRMRREYRAVAYLRDSGHMLITSLVCRESQVLQSMIPSLREVARSLHWVTSKFGR